jgi:hypothetical protein
LRLAPVWECPYGAPQQNQDQIADDLRPAIEAVLDDLDRWVTPATK